MGKSMTLSAYAKRHNVTPKAAKVWIYEGKITSWEKVNGRYVIDADKCDVELELNSDPRYRATSAENGAKNNRSSKAENTRRAKPTVNKKSSLVDIKKAQALVDLERRTLQLEREKQILVERQAVYDTLFEFAQKVRGRIRAVPSRVVDDVMACADRVDALRLLSEAIDDALNELADTNIENTRV